MVNIFNSGRRIKWIRIVPEDFIFTIKVPNSLTLTHYYSKNKSEPLRKNPYFLNLDLFEEFLNILKSLKEQIGSLIFQLEYLKY